MRERDKERAGEIVAGISRFERRRGLPGLSTPARRTSLLEQILESIHRVEYVRIIRERDISPLRADTGSELFDPIKAAELCRREGEIDEAFWLVFLAIHFGYAGRSGWRLVRDVYGRLGQGASWDWESVSEAPEHFREWLRDNRNILQGEDGIKRKFGNHRKYESLNDGEAGTGIVIQSYVEWVLAFRDHAGLIAHAREEGENDRLEMFDYLYNSMKDVARFGRTARFDYLTMVGKLELAQIEPGSPYLSGATGPLTGAKLLFGGTKKFSLSASAANDLVIQFGEETGLGMQVLEDALCNWQKDTDQFIRFRG